ELGRVRPGETVGIQVDAYPGETFRGVISAVADKAEFTPKNVQTPDERTKLVFAVTIRISEGLDKLKPGMPADVLLPGKEGAQ
ncbi:multidrug transporter, partial [Anoxybacillus sp. LAT_38]|nr:multidrug transporter [Anoxybacillus sp. LAT_38]